ARRREESLQDTPIAISAFSAETLEQRQIVQTSDLERITPSLQFKPAGQLSGNTAASVVFIRGIGQLDPTAAVDPGVGVYIDEVYVGRSRSEEHTSELQSRENLVCRLLLEKKKNVVDRLRLFI